MKKILQFGNQILEKPSIEVKDVLDPKIKQLVKDMVDILEAEPERSAGLSAPQVGVLLRIAICRRTDLEGEISGEFEDDKKKKVKPTWEVMFNPEITYKSKESSVHWEGCLSVNHGDLFGQVERAREIEFNYMGVDGKQHNLKAIDFFSHVVQHEIDHLDGVLFLKYVDDPSKLYTGEELVKDNK